MFTYTLMALKVTRVNKQAYTIYQVLTQIKIQFSLEDKVAKNLNMVKDLPRLRL